MKLDCIVPNYNAHFSLFFSGLSFTYQLLHLSSIDESHSYRISMLNSSLSTLNKSLSRYFQFYFVIRYANGYLHAGSRRLTINEKMWRTLLKLPRNCAKRENRMQLTCKNEYIFPAHSARNCVSATATKSSARDYSAWIRIIRRTTGRWNVY